MITSNSSQIPASRLAFVTGGTGFLGRHLIPALLRAGWRVRVLARNPAAHDWLTRYPGVEVVRGDVTIPDSLTEPVRGADLIIHAAGLFRFWGDDALFDRTNVDGTRAMIAAALAAPDRPDGSRPRFVHISTIAVIGQPQPGRPVDETHPPHPVDPYQRSKWRAEQLVQEQAAALNAVIVRPGAFYGPLGHYAFNRLFFRDPLRGLLIEVNGGRYVTFPVYIGDVAAGVLLAAERGGVGEVYNIVGDSLTHREVFAIVRTTGRLWYPRIRIPGWLGVAGARVLTAISAITRREPFYPINMRSYVYNDWRCSNAKARLELGFVPLEFAEGARRTLAWYQAGQPAFIPEVEL